MNKTWQFICKNMGVNMKDKKLVKCVILYW